MLFYHRQINKDWSLDLRQNPRNQVGLRLLCSKMVGGGNRKDDSLVINSTNVFAALGTLRKKKKSDKEQGSSKTSRSSSRKKKDKDEPEPQVFWAPAPLTAKSWADVDDEDDDDYYATTAPLQSVWAGDQPEKAKESSTPIEATESEEDGLDEVDDDNEEEHDHEPEMPAKNEPIVEKPVEAPKDTDRQLSKKELKKKELAELEAVLAELGYPKSEASGQEDPLGVAREKKVQNPNGDLEKKENNAPSESKSAKKKKKKDKASKEAKEQQDQPNSVESGITKDETAGTERAEEPSGVDVKDKIKKAAPMKKKKSSKEMDAAARAAASEAAARSARLAAAKKKEKNHYNQQPVR